MYSFWARKGGPTLRHNEEGVVPVNGPPNAIERSGQREKIVLLHLKLVDLLLIGLPIMIAASVLVVYPFATIESSASYGAGAVARLFGLFVFCIFAAIHGLAALIFSVATRRNSSFRVGVAGILILQLIVATTLLFVFLSPRSNGVHLIDSAVDPVVFCRPRWIN